jgi:hypothetical protein
VFLWDTYVSARNATSPLNPKNKARPELERTWGTDAAPPRLVLQTDSDTTDHDDDESSGEENEKAAVPSKAATSSTVDTGEYKLTLGRIVPLCVQNVEKMKTLSADHNALHDAEALLAAIVAPSRLLLRTFTTKGALLPTAELVSQKKLKNDAVLADLSHPVHGGWTEDYSSVEYHIPLPQRTVVYDGEHCGPINQAAKETDLWALFLLYVPPDVLEDIAANTNAYASDEWVTKAESVFTRCAPDAHGARHRFDGGENFGLRAGELLVAFGIRVRQAALQVRTLTQSWSTQPGLRDDVIANAMSRDRYADILRFLHLEDNEKLSKEDAEGKQRDPLRKIARFIAGMNERFPKNYAGGAFLAMDESRSTNTGRGGISFFTYNPAKPITHGTNYYSLVCAQTGVVLQYIVQTPQCGFTPATVVAELLRRSGIFSEIGTRAKIVVTDSHYSAWSVSKELFGMGFLHLTTVKLSPKPKTPTDVTRPFYKLKPGVDKHVERGDYRVAFAEKDGAWTVCLRYKDKKMFMIQSTAFVADPPRGQVTMERRNRGVGGKTQTLPSHPALFAYLKNYGGVDMMDRGIADFSTQYKCNRFYIRMFWYNIDMVIYACWKIAQARIPTGGADESAKQAAGKKKTFATDKAYRKYAPGAGSSSCRGRFLFTLDLATNMIAKGRTMMAADAALVAAASSAAATPRSTPSRRSSTSSASTPSTAGRGMPSPLVGKPHQHLQGLQKMRCVPCELLAERMYGTVLDRDSRRKLVKHNAQLCYECSVLMCAHCFESTWDHTHKALKVGTQLTPAIVISCKPELQTLVALAAVAPKTLAGGKRKRALNDVGSSASLDTSDDASDSSDDDDANFDYEADFEREAPEFDFYDADDDNMGEGWGAQGATSDVDSDVESNTGSDESGDAESSGDDVDDETMA